MTGPAPARHRLHPLSPLLHSAKSLAVIVAAISWQGYARLGTGRWLAVVAGLLVMAVVGSVVSWYTTGYRIVGRELRIDEGVLWRRSRAIPLERLQSVEVRRPALAQLAGLAELRLEVAGGAKTEAPLAYLALAEAHRLRDDLLTHTGGGAAAAAPPVPAPPLYVVRDRDLVVAQLLTPELWAAPVAATFVVYQAVSRPDWSLIALASTATALLAVIAQPVRRTLRHWRFQLGRGPAGLSVAHGLVDHRQQIVPTDRVQSVRVVWPLLWRGHGWLRLHLDVAGYAPGEGGAETAVDTLLPVGTNDVARYLLPVVLPGARIDLTAARVPPPRAAWLAPLARPYLAVEVGDTVVAVGGGVLTRRLTLVSRPRIQSVRVTAGPVQRLLGLATVHVDTAAGSVAAVHRDEAEAWWLAAVLSTPRPAPPAAPAQPPGGRPGAPPA
ncbi:MAG TPA: PH domain-containing protein [Pilimelia sp.]|nr:PH domain-containing protein [Pilimelia sp.]